MKALILLSLLFCTIFCGVPRRYICSLPPKRRPIECFIGQVLDEDIPELKELLEKYRDGDDNEFNDYLGDMFDKKLYREGKAKPIRMPLGKCTMNPRHLPFSCYEIRVLRRNRNELKEAYDTLYEENFEEFNKILVKLVKAKKVYFAPKTPIE